jgi:hypothetical protein
VSGTFALVFVVFFLAAASFTAEGVSGWTRDALILSLCAVLTVPVWLSGLILLTSFMEKALYGPAGRSWLKVAFLVAGSWLFMLLWLAAWNWPIWSAVRGDSNPFIIVLAGFLIVALHACALAPLAQSSLLRKRVYEEWGRLPIDIPS